MLASCDRCLDPGTSVFDYSYELDAPSTCGNDPVATGCPTSNFNLTAYSERHDDAVWAAYAQWWTYYWDTPQGRLTHWFKGWVHHNATDLHFNNREQNSICHESGHELGLAHHYDQQYGCLEDSVGEWECKTLPVCDYPSADEKATVDNLMLDHEDPWYTDPLCVFFPCDQFGPQGSGSSPVAGSEPILERGAVRLLPHEGKMNRVVGPFMEMTEHVHFKRFSTLELLHPQGLMRVWETDLKGKKLNRSGKVAGSDP